MSTAEPGFLERRWPILLGSILLLAAALRLVRLGESPPGMHVDAAANAWNAWCLLHTGTDWRGDPWPIFYTRGFGENVPTLYLYALLPFQALAGMSSATTALPSALAGILAVGCVFCIGRRLWGTGAGLLGAGYLALTPEALFLGRWGHESGLVLLQVAGPVAALLWAGLPVAGTTRTPLRTWRAALAGVATGVACYGYFAVRILLPLLLLAAVAVAPRPWIALLRERRCRLGLAAFAVALGATFGPLVVRHLTDPAMAKRSVGQLAWVESDPLPVKVARAVGRYPAHFDPAFLFFRGDPWPTHRLPSSGTLGWFLLPGLVLGVVALAAEARRSPAARFLIAWVLLHPVPDLFMTHPGPHALRSAGGLPAFVLVAALGTVRGGAWLRARGRVHAGAAAVVLLAAVLFFGGRFVHAFLWQYGAETTARHHFNADLLAATEWVRPRLDEVDAVFFSCARSAALNQPFVLVLVGLDYDPARWFREPIGILERPNTDLYKRFGKVHFLFDDTDRETLRGLMQNGRRERVLLVLRPGEWKDPGRMPVHTIRHPDGRAAYAIYDEAL